MSKTDEPGLPAVDVLMPVYNGEKHLDDQIRTVLGQSGVAVVLHVLDDASSDSSWAIITGWVERDPRVRGIRQAENAGLASSLDVLLRMVRSEYFALADQDDVWDSLKLRDSIRGLSQRGASLAFSRVRVVDERGRLLASDYHQDHRVKWYTPSSPFSCVFENPVIGHTVVGTKQLAASVRRSFTEVQFHEVLLVATALELSGVAPVSRTLGSYRQHQQNVAGARRKSRALRVYLRLVSSARLVERHSVRRRALLTLAGPEIVGRIGYHSAQRRLARAMRSLSLFCFVKAAYSSGGFALALREVALNVLTPAYAPAAKRPSSLPSPERIGA
jgi:glycosyltransferase involved in cell wall biosynthesis